MKLTILICRLIIAITFIFSGFVKAIDPVGFAIKMDEYLLAFHMEWFTKITLPLAILLISIEFLLGFYLLIGFYVRKMIPLIILVMSGFTLLTLYSAIFNPVSDCGCFGDAVKLTNWETFWKNVILMAPTLGLFYYRKKFNELWSKKIGTISSAVLGLVFIVGLCVYSYNNLPIIDFRPYKIGTHISSDMKFHENAEQPEYETTFIMEKNGEIMFFSLENYPWDDTTYVFIDTETRIINEGYTPPLQNFMVTNIDFEDVTSDIVERNGAVFLMISHNLKKANKSSIKNFVNLSEIAKQKNIPFYCITSSDYTTAEIFANEHNAWFDYLQCDETTLKTIVRSNPALLLLHDGIIVGKWHFKNFPEKKILNNPLSYSMKELKNKNKTLIIWINIFLILVSINTLIINRIRLKR